MLVCRNSYNPKPGVVETFRIFSAVTTVPQYIWSETSPREILREVPNPAIVKMSLNFLPEPELKSEYPNLKEVDEKPELSSDEKDLEFPTQTNETKNEMDWLVPNLPNVTPSARFLQGLDSYISDYKR